MISIGMTAHGRIDFVRSAVESVVRQAAQSGPIEIILATDIAPERVDKLSLDRRVRVVEERGSFGNTLNAIIDNSRGEIIAFLDDDDLFAPDKLQVLRRVFQEHPELDYVHNEQRYIDGAGHLLTDKFKTGILLKSRRKRTVILRPDHLSWKQLGEVRRLGMDFNLSCVAISRKFGVEVGPLIRPITAAPDGALFYLALERARVMMALEEPLTYYRIHGSTTNPVDPSVLRSERSRSQFQRQAQAFQSISIHLTKSTTSRMLGLDIELRSMRSALGWPNDKPVPFRQLPQVLAQAFRLRDRYALAVVALYLLNRFTPEGVVAVLSLIRGGIIEVDSQDFTLPGTDGG